MFLVQIAPQGLFGVTDPDFWPAVMRKMQEIRCYKFLENSNSQSQHFLADVCSIKKK